MTHISVARNSSGPTTPANRALTNWIYSKLIEKITQLNKNAVHLLQIRPRVY